MKIVLNIFFKIFKAIINKLLIPTNKTSKKNWDWLKLDKDETFTKILATLFYFGFFGLFMLIVKNIIYQFLIPSFYLKHNIFAIGIINFYQLYSNVIMVIYGFTWLITMIIIIKNHNKKPLIQKIK
jgi:hypothetical protein